MITRGPLSRQNDGTHVINRRSSSFVLCLIIGVLGVASLSMIPLSASTPNVGGLPRDPDPNPASPSVVPNATIGTRPTMGWNSWNAFACNGLDETLVKQTADAMVSSGLLAAGYNTLTLDDCWSAVSRDSSGNITSDPAKFPSGMKAVGDYIHARGLRYGLYASIGTATCTGHTAGSLDHEAQDVATFASWGVDYIKADRCNASGLVMKDIYARWRDAIVASGRPILLSASDNTPSDQPWAWGPVTAHQWRMSGDISDDWGTMIAIFDRNAAHAAASAPGGFNDPDMLEVGNGGMSDTEYETHLGLWALMAAPLIAGNDVRNLSDTIRVILTNPEVIAVDQDAFGFQAIKAGDNGAGQQVWYKPLSSLGGRAVGLLNRGNAAATIGVDWASIGLAPGNATVRDLWARTDRGTFADRYSANVPPHGLVLLRIVGTDQGIHDGYLSDQPWTYMANEVGPVERNQSNGGPSAGDGHTLTLNGVSYAKGLGTNAPSAIEFRPSGSCSAFTAEIGIDDEVGNRGSVIFRVWADGQRIYESGLMTGTTLTGNVSLDLSGVQSLRLETVAVDSTSYDSADWAKANVTCSTKSNVPPRAAFSVSSSLVRPGDPVTFNGSASSDSDGTIRSYSWDFGDGFADYGPVVGHSYAHAGTFTVILTVVDDGGASGSATANVTVTPVPHAAFSASPRSTLPNVSIQFDASNSTDPGGRIVLYAWDFGDGATNQGRIVTYAYPNRGIFTVRLTVTDNMGMTNETTNTVAIGNRPPVIRSTSPASATILHVGETGIFVVDASDPDGDRLTFSWTIDGLSVGSSSSAYAFISMVPGTFVIRVVTSDGFAAVLYEWHVDVQPTTGTSPPPPPSPPSTPPPSTPSPPAAEISGTVASAGVFTLGVLLTIVTHALRGRKGGKA